ncbi:fumarylacetoacetate hydrolase family protein [Amycolatopsis jejuensis]|uniref:fumarylacetoacetate hydrolase family protein n=1 Tax=Amycolatopsis jejuensis TaxID=330084 RepID=UPI00068FC06B|nr:fumarylacetoacetate hydrolase family protein [Amycolatopsis jejuensis]
MKLVRVRARGESRFAFVESDDRFRLLPPNLSLADALRSEPGGETVPAGEWELLAPVPSPASLRDFVGHLQHIRNTRRSRGVVDPLPPEWAARPAFYFANPHSLHSCSADIAIPAGSKAFDFELEIAVVVGKGGRDLTLAEAGEAIAGYVLYCDWSARDIQTEERAMQIGQGKGKDSAISLGPWILPAADAAPFVRADGLDFPVSVQVNGEEVTAPGTRYAGMDWTFSELVAYASAGVDLVPGEVIAAGTVPTGCLLEHSGADDFRGWLAPGDEVRLSAGPLGEITSTILPGVPLAAWRRP